MGGPKDLLWEILQCFTIIITFGLVTMVRVVTMALRGVWENRKKEKREKMHRRYRKIMWNVKGLSRKIMLGFFTIVFFITFRFKDFKTNICCYLKDFKTSFCCYLGLVTMFRVNTL